MILPGSVIGNTLDFDSDISGSSPGRAATFELDSKLAEQS